jgi:hypothetical protein
LAKRKKQAFERKMAYERNLAYERDPLPDEYKILMKEETFSEKVSSGVALAVGGIFLVMVLQAIVQIAIQFYHFLTGLW